MADEARARRVAAMRAADRMLSGARPVTMRERLARWAARDDTDAPHDVYGDGPVTALEERVAGLLGTEAAVFFPSGVMAQQVALRYGADRSGNHTVALHPLGHQEVHENHAYAQVSALRSIWPTTEPRNPSAAEIAALGEPVSTVVFELPLRDAGFTLPTWDDLAASCAAAHDAGARVHLDGARLWDAAPGLGRAFPEITALADSTYVSFYKALGGISGAALAGDAALAGYARLWRQRYGGTLFQQWPAVLAAFDGLDHELARIPEYTAHARTVAAALAGLPGARVFPEPPHTHQFRLFLPFTAEALNRALVELAEQEKVWVAGPWRDTEVPGVAMTEVTAGAAALDWTADDIADVGARFLARAAGG